MDPEAGNPRLFAQARKPVLTVPERFAISFAAKGILVGTQEHPLALRERSEVAPLLECGFEFVGHCDPVEFAPAFAFSRPQANAVAREIHVIPGQLEKFGPSGSRMEIGQQHDLVLACREVEDGPEILDRRNVARMLLAGLLFRVREGVLFWPSREVSLRPVPCRDQVLSVLVGSIAASVCGLAVEMVQTDLVNGIFQGRRKILYS